MNEKSLKSYEGEIEKMTHLINELENEMAKKDEEYRELYHTFSELKKNKEQNFISNERASPRKSKSLRASRKSLRAEM